MVVYVNDRNEICAVESTDNVNLTPLTINDEGNPFANWSAAKICCYKVNVSDGMVTMMTPYVDSRLIPHYDGLGVATEVNSSDILDTEMALTESYEETNNNLTDIELAVVELYEMITPTEESNKEDIKNG